MNFRIKISSLILILLIAMVNPVLSQSIYGFGSDCTCRNEAIFYQLLLDSYGEITVSNWMNNKKKFVVAINIDSIGYPNSLTYWRGFDSDDEVNVFKEKILKSKYKFQVCSDDNYEGADDKKMRRLLTEENRGKNSYWITLAFNPPLNDFWIKKRLKAKVDTMSNLVILKYFIDEYFPLVQRYPELFNFEDLGKLYDSQL